MIHRLGIMLLFLGIALIWIGTVLYIYPFMLWVLPSIFLGAVLIFSGALIFGVDVLLIARGKSESRMIFISLLIIATVIIVWGALYLISLIRLLL